MLDYKEHENGPALLFRYLDPNAVRFDHYLATHGQKLTPASGSTCCGRSPTPSATPTASGSSTGRLGRRASSSPMPTSPTPRLQVYNWQVGVREAASTSGRVTNVEDLVEAQALVYMSPEAMSDSRKVTEASDVFSLGAIAFHLFASRPPASNPTELAKILREQKGLSISSVLDGAGPKLEELIQWSTHPDVLTRIGSVEDFLTLLDDVEDELTAPTETVVADPLQAKRGDRLPHGFVVERVLGQGATAIALLVTQGRQGVRPQGGADRGRQRPAARRGRGPADRSTASSSSPSKTNSTMSGRTVLVLQKAGDKTLAAHAAQGRRAQLWRCWPATATTCCRRWPRWNVMASPTGTSSPTTSASAR